eukprot:comp11662_c0_seq1/m.6177 comp11662_c0_seq1/g.6177  ORF comp11662_c0_seq1/g.6177 comp11662_c0_seq1/m.6177 type:complete len:683 (-) comp11662_c0_seq1:103-2151(-)
MSDSEDDLDPFSRHRTNRKPVSKSMKNLGIDLKLSDFAKKDFRPTEYVLQRASTVITYSELADLSLFTEKMSEETAQKLKKNVFENYPKFINTSKEISNLESDMQDLRGLLSDSMSIMKGIGELSSVGFDEQDESKRIQRHNKLLEIMSLVENCPDLLSVPDRDFVFEESFKEVDESTYAFVRPCHIFIFTDALMVTTVLTQRKQSLRDADRVVKRYRFLYLWDMASLLLIDINKKNKNPDELMNAFRIMHPQAVTYQARELQIKMDFLYTVGVQQKRLKEHSLQRQEKLRREKEEEELREKRKNEEASENMEMGSLTPSDLKILRELDWLVDVPDDLDVFIAQRDFDKAVALVQKTKAVLASNAIENNMLKAEMAECLEARLGELTDILIHELQNPNMKNVAMQKSIQLCIKLGQTSKARNMFLKNRSDALKRDIKRVKVEGATEMYISKLSRMVFANLRNVMDEFLASFADIEDRSAFVVWAVKEVQHFVQIFIRQVFHGTDLTVVTESLDAARRNMAVLEEVGMNLHYVVQTHVRPHLMGAVDAEVEAINAAVMQRLTSTQAAYYRHPYDTHQVMLHPSTKAFCTAMERFVTNISNLDFPELEPFLLDKLRQLFDAQAQRMCAPKDPAKGGDANTDFAVDKDYLVNVFLDHMAKAMGDRLSDGKKTLIKIQRDIATRML